MEKWLNLDRLLADQPISRKLGLIVATFVSIICTLFLISHSGMAVLSGVRAIVGGEGLWSKAQKDAIYHLRRYAETKDEREYASYRQFLKVPLGDHKARLGLAARPPQYPEIFEGFVEGRNHPEDASMMADIFLHLSYFSYVRKATEIWTAADGYMDQIQGVAARLHREISSRKPDTRSIQETLSQLDAINGKLTPLEDDFSYTLGEGARRVKSIVLGAMVLSTLLLMAVGLYIVVVISRHLSREIENLRAAAQRVAAGDFRTEIHAESTDEIGDLANAFQQMVSQRRKAEEALARHARELDAANRRLIEAERIKDDFFAKVSHELRTPLTLILAPLESILSKDYGEISPTQRRSLEVAHNNSVRLLQMVTGLLDFSKLEAGKVEVRREPIEIVALTKSLFDDFTPIWRKKRLLAQFDADPAASVVSMDRYLYERIIFNLLSNATKFTSEGGKIFLSLKWSGGRLGVCVQDTGIGITHSNITKLFRKFQQLEAASTRRFEGTGLGLALIKEFVALLDGTVTVESAEGRGSSFSIECMAPPAEEPSAALTKSRLIQPYEPPPNIPKRKSDEAAKTLPRLLVAEDNLELAQYIAEILKPFFRVETAHDGQEALEMIVNDPPDILLTDVMMPSLDGLELCRALKANSKTADIPVLMLSALTHRDALLKGWEAGADEYLYKPFHPRELMTRVLAMISNHQNRKAAQEADQRLKVLLVEIKHRQALDSMKDDFISTVSHELRTPLAIVQGAVDNLRDGVAGALKPEQKQAVNLASRNILRLAKMIDNLLDLSRLESGRGKLNRSAVDLSKLADEIAQGLKVVARKRRIELISDIPESLPAISADPDMLARVFTNVLDNALRFARAKVTLAAEASEDAIHIRISDDGEGIPSERLSELFNKFVQVNRVAGVGYKGTGLGLAICKEIVSQHQGTITAESAPGSGATFHIRLPFSTALSRK